MLIKYSKIMHKYRKLSRPTDIIVHHFSLLKSIAEHPKSSNVIYFVSAERNLPVPPDSVYFYGHCSAPAISSVTIFSLKPSLRIGLFNTIISFFP